MHIVNPRTTTKNKEAQLKYNKWKLKGIPIILYSSERRKDVRENWINNQKRQIGYRMKPNHTECYVSFK